MAGRVLWAGLHILDRQLIDRDGNMCGNADDLEIAPLKKSGPWYVTAIHSGPGALATRLGHTRFGGWVERVHAYTDEDVLRPIPFDKVTDIGSAVKLAADAGELPASATQRWVRDHVIAHIPGARHAAE
jgi:hypothetical protein